MYLFPTCLFQKYLSTSFTGILFGQYIRFLSSELLYTPLFSKCKNLFATYNQLSNSTASPYSKIGFYILSINPTAFPNFNNHLTLFCGMRRCDNPPFHKRYHQSCDRRFHGVSPSHQKSNTQGNLDAIIFKQVGPTGTRRGPTRKRHRYQIISIVCPNTHQSPQGCDLRSHCGRLLTLEN